MVVGGPMPGGAVFDGRKSDQTSIDEALGMLQVGKIGAEDVLNLENTACPACGSCAFLGTANTMGWRGRGAGPWSARQRPGPRHLCPAAAAGL